MMAIALGASAGAVMRWWLGYLLNGSLTTIFLGTLVANLIGSYIAGVAIALLASYPGASPAWRLLIITGFAAA
jgi:CrcB protein